MLFFLFVLMLKEVNINKTFTCCAKSSQCGPQCGTEGGGGGLAKAQRGGPRSRLARTLRKKRGALGRAVEGRRAVEGAPAQSASRPALLLRLLGGHGTERTVCPTTQTTIGAASRCSCCCNCSGRRREKDESNLNASDALWLQSYLLVLLKEI